MDKKKLVQIIENFAPLQLAEPWDCSGWLVETDKVDVNKVMFCLTVTDDVVKQAKAQNCDMIISHHPLFEINCHSELVSESRQFESLGLRPSSFSFSLFNRRSKKKKTEPKEKERRLASS